MGSRIVQRPEAEPASVEGRRQELQAAIHEPEGWRLLAAALGDDHWRVRKEALGCLHRVPAGPELAQHLARNFYPGPNVGLRNASVQALAAQGAFAVEALSLHLRELDADGRKLAAEALAATAEPTALELLATLLGDSDQNVRLAAMEGIAALGHLARERAAELLGSSLEQGDEFSQIVTLEVFARLKLVPSWSQLERLLERPVLAQAALKLAVSGGYEQAAEHFQSAIEGSVGNTRRELVVDFEIFAGRSAGTHAAAQAAALELGQPAVVAVRALAAGLDDPAAAGAAVVVLALRKDEYGAQLALPLVGDPVAQGSVTRALLQLGLAAVDPLIEEALDPDAEHRAACIELLVRLVRGTELETSVAHRLRALDADCEPSLLRAWLDAAAAIEDESGLLRALRWLRDEMPTAVQLAAKGAACAYGLRYPQAAVRLATELAEGHSGAAQAAAVAALSRVVPEPLLGSAEADEALLISILSREEAVARVAALEALARCRSSRALDAVGFAASDERSAVRRAAIETLAQMRDSSGSYVGTGRVLRLMGAEADSPTVVAALSALGSAGDPAALPKIQALAGAAPAHHAVAAVHALLGFEEGARLEGLRRALVHTDSEVVKAALVAQGALSAPLVDSTLLTLEHPAWDVRRLAVDVLARCDEERVRNRLRDRLAKEGEVRVIDALRRSVSKRARDAEGVSGANEAGD